MVGVEIIVIFYSMESHHHFEIFTQTEKTVICFFKVTEN